MTAAVSHGTVIRHPEVFIVPEHRRQHLWLACVAVPFGSLIGLVGAAYTHQSLLLGAATCGLLALSAPVRYIIERRIYGKVGRGNEQGDDSA